MIVALMAAAFVIVAISEWLAARARFVPPAVAFLPPPTTRRARAVRRGCPRPPGSRPAVEPAEDTEPEALDRDRAARLPTTSTPRDAVDPWEREAAVDDEAPTTSRAGADRARAAEREPSTEPEQEPVLAERGGIFRRAVAELVA